jgi:putative transposase
MERVTYGPAKRKNPGTGPGFTVSLPSPLEGERLGVRGPHATTFAIRRRATSPPTATSPPNSAIENGSGGARRPLLDPADGVLVVDDATLDKPRAKHIALVARHWSGNHRAVVSGINLVTLLWSDGDRLYPTDYRVYHKATDGKTKNDHFGQMLDAAHARGFRPTAVLFDGWYASVANLKRVRGFGWVFVTRLPSDRKVRIAHGPAAAVSAQVIAASGTEVWLPEFGLVRVFRVVAPNGDTTHWATNDVGMAEDTRRMFAELSWGVEEYHRGLKQFTGVERCQARAARCQRNHIGCAIRAFVRLEYHRFTTGVGWFAAK